MTDNKNDPTRPADPQAGKRPYATLDLKATEIKVTSIAEKMTGTSSGSAQASAMSGSAPSEKPEVTPKPAPASSYATADAAEADVTIKAAAKSDSAPQSAQHSAQSSKPAAPASPSAAAPASSASSTAQTTARTSQAAAVAVKKRGGFFSHLAASIIGAGLVLAGWQYAAPMLGIKGFGVDTSGITESVSTKIATLEKTFASSGLAEKLQAAEARAVALEKQAAEKIATLRSDHIKLAADTKAALAASASDKGGPEMLLRLAALEEKLKALTEAGANDPNAGRVPQLAALTGKVADLETALSTQLTATRKSVSEDVEARIAAVAAASEAAKSGTLRLDKDLAGLKSDSIRMTERLQAMKTDSDKLAENLKIAQEENAALKAQLEAVRGSTAKPADVASAVAPVSQKLASLEQNVQNIVKAEADRRSSAERIVLSLELQNLKRVLDRGQKYDAELAEVQKAAGGKFDLSALAKFKDGGVPTLPDLSRDFRATANAAIDADLEPADGSVVGRLIAGAKSVVRVRKVSNNPDDKSAEAVIGRMETALKEGRLGEVLEQSKVLPEKARASAGPFLEKVAARNSVDGALAALEGQLKSSLSAAPGEPQKSVQ